MGSPGHFEGRLEIGIAIAEARSTPDQDVIRYTFNRFVASQSVFLPTERWIRCYRDAPFPAGRPWIAVDRTPDWSYATITVNLKVGDNVHTEVAASVVRPTIERLADLCDMLRAGHEVAGVVLDGYSLRDLGNELKRRGWNTHIATQGDMLTASSLLFAKVIRGTLKHSGDELLARQIPHTIRKNVGEAFRISRKDSATAIDAVISTALGTFAVETLPDVGVQVF